MRPPWPPLASRLDANSAAFKANAARMADKLAGYGPDARYMVRRLIV
jgi:hypothetical protein